MFRHEKQLLHPVRIERPNPEYATLLTEQLGGPHGELKAAMQYLSQSFCTTDPRVRDLFLDIGSEELGHMEMVAATVRLLNGGDLNAREVEAGSIQSHVLGGLGPQLTTASGHPWTAAYVNSTGDLAADLLSNIAAEQRAKVVYEYLHRQIEDEGVRETIDFLLNREEAHNALFREALNDVQESGSSEDFGVDDDARLYFDLSSPGQYYAPPSPTPPAFHNPRAESRGQDGPAESQDKS